MVKVFKNYILSAVMAITFSFSQVVSVNANYLISNSQKEKISVSVIESEKEKAINMAAFHVPTVSYGEKNGAPVEGKVENVVETVTVAMGLLVVGYALNIIGSIIGWVKDIVVIFK
ncbi:hypothetical protein [Bartonella taylorii]|uniref:hypothetical protein n=1 Tax=Bartonella taylorii TaxID=33046 RepID=UPI001ABA17AF|nr:hypothetical protein [Bartonella taylorii]